MSNSCPIWFLLGAGASAGAPASISLWGEISQDTQQFLYKTLEYKVRATGGDGYLHAREALESITKRALPEIILESLVRVYGKSSAMSTLRAVLSPSDASPNLAHRAIARLCKQGRVAGILTTNFDELLEQALTEEGVVYHVATTGNLPQDAILPVVKLHGTVSNAESLAFMRNDYYFRLHRQDIAPLMTRLANTHLVIVGYSGNDIDIFPTIRAMVQGSHFFRVTVVDRTPLATNQRYYPIRDSLEYHTQPAESMLSQLAGMPVPSAPEPRKRRISAVVPTDDKYSAALFFGDCLLSLGLEHSVAFKLFFLTQDIVEEETGDGRQLCVSHFAKSCALLAMGDATWAESEYSLGRTLLHSILQGSALSSQGDMLSEFGASLAALYVQSDVARRHAATASIGGHLLPVGSTRFDDSARTIDCLRTVMHWEFRARIGLCFAALGAARNPSLPKAEQQQMLAIPGKLMQGFRNWEHRCLGRDDTDELPLLPRFYSRFFLAYKCFLGENRVAISELDACTKMAKLAGFQLGLAQLYFLRKLFHQTISYAELKEYEAIKELCGIDEKSILAPSFSVRTPFELTVTNYTPQYLSN